MAWKLDDQNKWVQVSIKDAITWYSISKNRLIRSSKVGKYLIQTHAMGVRSPTFETTVQVRRMFLYDTLDFVETDTYEDAIKAHEQVERRWQSCRNTD